MITAIWQLPRNAVN